MEVMETNLLLDLIEEAKDIGGYCVGYDQAQCDVEDIEHLRKWSDLVFHELPSMAMELEMDDDDEMNVIWNIQNGYFNGLLDYFLDPKTPFTKEVVDIMVGYLKDDRYWHDSVKIILEKLVEKDADMDVISFVKKSFALWDYIDFMVPEDLRRVYCSLLVDIYHDLNKMSRKDVFKKYSWVLDNGINTSLSNIEDHHGGFSDWLDFNDRHFGDFFRLAIDLGMLCNSSILNTLSEIIYSKTGENLDHEDLEIIESDESSFMVQADEEFYIIRLFPKVAVDVI